MIGDTYTDYQFARNCGIRSIICNFGYGNFNRFQGIVDVTLVDKVSDLSSLLIQS
jgi:phosphoglycolate phosphatase-like HAD superfamily hydrolase